MRDINFYLDTAKVQNGFKSDNELQRALGYKGAMVCYLRSGKTKISDEKMIELAHLAGQDEDQALMDLNMWRSPSPAVQKAYANILHKLSYAAMLIAFVSVGFVGFASPSHAITDNSYNVYYGK